MILGKTTDWKRVRRNRKRSGKAYWSYWYAWYPVKLLDGRIAWFERVQRKDFYNNRDEVGHDEFLKRRQHRS